MKGKRIYTYGGKPARRNLTVADIVALKGVRKLSQTCPGTEEEAAACEAVGNRCPEHVPTPDLPSVRVGAPETFTIADLPMTVHHTADDILRAAVRAGKAAPTPSTHPEAWPWSRCWRAKTVRARPSRPGSEALDAEGRPSHRGQDRGRSARAGRGLSPARGCRRLRRRGRIAWRLKPSPSSAPERP